MNHPRRADRIRSSSPKVVFVVGVNEDVFPRNPQIKGILNGDERLLLLEQGLTVSDAGLYRVFEERLIAYETLCCASDKLFVSYARKDLKGGRMTASELVAQIKRLFSACVRSPPYPSHPGICGRGAGAFELTAKLLRQGDDLRALRADFEAHERIQ
jgi:ATP-dependent helicase/DNAse subunit B